MRPLFADTPLDVEEVWLAAQRRLQAVGRLERAVELTDLCWYAAWDAVRRAFPDAAPDEQDRLFLTAQYGAELAAEVVQKRREKGFYD